MLPESIPTVHLTAQYLSLDGRPLSGNVEFQPPVLLTHAEADLFVGGPTLAALDAEGRIDVTLPATDAEGWNPFGWTYTVTERIAGAGRNRTYRIALSATVPEIDLADIAPADPAGAQYVTVPGPAGPQGEPGPQGPAGPVRSVNGHTEGDIILLASEVGAVASSAAGQAGGVAQLDAEGKVPKAQLPDGTGEGVTSVNGQTGTVTLAAADLGALTPASADTRYLAIGAAPVTSVNGQTGAITLTSGDLGAVSADQAVLLSGAQTIDGAKTFSTAPAVSADPADANQLVRRSYVDTVASSGTWTPASLGFKAWAFDPAASSVVNPQYCISGTVYLIGIPLTTDATITNVVFYVPGFVGTGLAATSFAGLYTSTGARVGLTGTLDKLITKTEGATFVLKLTTAYVAAAGNYWVALLINGPDPKTNGPAFMVGASVGNNPGGSARMPNHFVRHARLAATGQTSLPTSFTPSTIVADTNAIWAAVS
ncbi:phage tail protein [Streptomyces poriferorum]|uniref:Phage tail protein n=1 Tax=Streptomyces poriferorum TaxID=2798799 RepID=A0ABY9ISF1_9ACTN|nr:MULTISPECIES: phage tail protein [unclassified Streptomyces]MDP5314036.1 phage tail protein [Streptomyces sp. Alt4]WLQ50306.1 phage tail protein [Streptomyces sp. Alt1]WLQ57027.1 phage tail protein [Streptomyces sp. Alt2]WSI65106.1 phage tail protein [Streptomyces sp. NBC_01336]